MARTKVTKKGGAVKKGIKGKDVVVKKGKGATKDVVKKDVVKKDVVKKGKGGGVKKEKCFKIDFTDKHLKEVLKRAGIKGHTKTSIMSAWSSYYTYEEKRSSIKRPLNEWMYYCKDHRESVKNSVIESRKKEGTWKKDSNGKFPNIPTQEVTKLLKSNWDEMSESEKSVYKDAAASDRERYHREMEELNNMDICEESNDESNNESSESNENDNESNENDESNDEEEKVVKKTKKAKKATKATKKRGGKK